MAVGLRWQRAASCRPRIVVAREAACEAHQRVYARLTHVATGGLRSRSVQRQANLLVRSGKPARPRSGLRELDPPYHAG
jgi:hypothetical protein